MVRRAASNSWMSRSPEAKTRMSRGPAAWLEWMTSSAQARATAVGMSIGVSRSRPRPSRSEAVGAADSSHTLFAGHRAGFEPGHGPHQRGRGAQWLVDDLHRVGASGHLDHRHRRVQRVFEMLLELDRVDGGGGDNELQVTAAGEQRRQVAEAGSRC